MKHNLQSILEAAFYAAEKHTSQRRKGAAAEPYINHLIDVARMASSATTEPDPTLVIAALLHDSVEDAGVTAEELSKRFGPDVADLVMEVTDDKSLPKAERKRLQIQNAPHKSPRAQIIKLADKISNLKSILASPPPDWSYERKKEYFEWAKNVVAGLREPDPELLAEFNRLLDAFSRGPLAGTPAKVRNLDSQVAIDRQFHGIPDIRRYELKPQVSNQGEHD